MRRSAAGRWSIFSFALNYAWAGVQVRSYHLANLGIHLLAALVLFGIVRRTWEAVNSAPPKIGLRISTLVALADCRPLVCPLRSRPNR